MSQEEIKGASTITIGEVNAAPSPTAQKVFDDDSFGYQIFTSPSINPLLTPLVEEFLGLHASDPAYAGKKPRFSFVVSDSTHVHGRRIDDIVGAAAVSGDPEYRFTEKRAGSTDQVAVRVVSDAIMEQIADQMGGEGTKKAVHDYLTTERSPGAVLTIVAWDQIFVQIFEQITPDKQLLSNGGEIMIPLNPIAKA